MRLTFIFISHAVGSNTGCQTLKLKPRCYRCHQAKEALAVLPADSQLWPLTTVQFQLNVFLNLELVAQY